VRERREKRDFQKDIEENIVTYALCYTQTEFIEVTDARATFVGSPLAELTDTKEDNRSSAESEIPPLARNT